MKGDHSGSMGYGMDCTCVYLPNVCVEALVSNVIIFGVGAFGRWVSALVRRGERVCFLSLPCQDTARGLPSVNQEEGPH